MQSKTFTSIGYCVQNYENGILLHQKEEFLIVFDRVSNFKKHPQITPQINMFRDIFMHVALGYNLIFFRKAYQRFVNCCSFYNIFLPEFKVMLMMNLDLYFEIQTILYYQGYNYKGEEFAIIPSHILIDHPLAEHYRFVLEFLEISKN